jgi:hypothetical protein
MDRGVCANISAKYGNAPRIFWPRTFWLKRFQFLVSKESRDRIRPWNPSNQRTSNGTQGAEGITNRLSGSILVTNRRGPHLTSPNPSRSSPFHPMTSTDLEITQAVLYLHPSVLHPHLPRLRNMAPLRSSSGSTHSNRHTISLASTDRRDRLHMLHATTRRCGWPIKVRQGKRRAWMRRAEPELGWRSLLDRNRRALENRLFQPQKKNNMLSPQDHGGESAMIAS